MLITDTSSKFLVKGEQVNANGLVIVKGARASEAGPLGIVLEYF